MQRNISISIVVMARAFTNIVQHAPIRDILRFLGGGGGRSAKLLFKEKKTSVRVFYATMQPRAYTFVWYLVLSTVYGVSKSPVRIPARIRVIQSGRLMPRTTIGPFFPSKDWINASEVINKTLHVWYPLGPSPERLYVFSEYNESSRNITFLKIPCGTVPSVKCLSEMINASMQGAHKLKHCEKQVYNPMLRAMPQWGLHVTLQKNQRAPFRTDSATLSYFGLSAMIAYVLQKENTTCDQGTIFPAALSKNTVKLARSINKTRIADFFKRLKIKRNITSTKFKTSNSSVPLTARQFLDYTMLVYITFSASIDCGKLSYNQKLMDGDDVISTLYGKFNTTALRNVSTSDDMPHVPAKKNVGVMRGYLHNVYLRSKMIDILNRDAERRAKRPKQNPKAKNPHSQ